MKRALTFFITTISAVPMTLAIAVIVFILLRNTCDHPWLSVWSSLGLAVLVMLVVAQKLSKRMMVCVGIILLFASVMSLASLNQSRSKGPDANVKSIVRNFRAIAEIHYEENNRSYAGLCTSTLAEPLMTALQEATQAESFVSCQGIVWNWLRSDLVTNLYSECRASDTGYVVFGFLPNSVTSEEVQWSCADNTYELYTVAEIPEALACQ